MARVIKDVAIGQRFEPYASQPDEPDDLLFQCPRCGARLGKHLIGHEEGAYFETELANLYVRLDNGSYGVGRRAPAKPVRLDLSRGPVVIHCWEPSCDRRRWRLSVPPGYAPASRLAR